jgi:ABC-type glutathione transport system ATPase component
MSDILNVKIEKIAVKKDSKSISILNESAFSLSKNKIYTIIGKNGSGKSTLFKTICRLLSKNDYLIRCKVILNNQNMYEMNDEDLLYVRKSKIRYVMQDTLGSFDPLKKIKYYFKLIDCGKSEIDQLLEYFLLPEYSEICTLYPYEISGGMAQRISIIISLLAKPELLLLDEPTSALDLALCNLLLLKLKEYVQSGDHSILLITQDILFAEKISDQIALLENGSLTEFSNPKEFLNNHKELVTEEKPGNE